MIGGPHLSRTEWFCPLVPAAAIDGDKGCDILKQERLGIRFRVRIRVRVMVRVGVRYQG